MLLLPEVILPLLTRASVLFPAKILVLFPTVIVPVLQVPAILLLQPTVMVPAALLLLLAVVVSTAILSLMLYQIDGVRSYNAVIANLQYVIVFYYICRTTNTFGTLKAPNLFMKTEKKVFSRILLFEKFEQNHTLFFRFRAS